MFFLNKNDFSPTWIDLVSIIIREKVPPDYKKPQAVMQLPHDGKDLGIVGTLELAGWTLKQHGQFGESWWSLRFNPTWSSSFFYPRCQHECFTELFNFKYFFKSCWSISGVTGRIILRQLYFEALRSCSPSIRSWKDLDQLPELPCLSSGSCCYRHHLCVAGLSFPTNYWVFWAGNFKKCATMVFWFHEIQWNLGEIHV